VVVAFGCWSRKENLTPFLFKFATAPCIVFERTLACLDVYNEHLNWTFAKEINGIPC
jgi:hypothetical protein